MRSLSRIVALSKIGSVRGDLNSIFGGVIVWRWPGEKANVRENDCQLQVPYLWNSRMLKDEYTFYSNNFDPCTDCLFRLFIQSIT